MTEDTEELLELAAAGNESAVSCLLSRYRTRLREMVRLRMDGRIAARCDPSDVVQEALLDAHRQLARYLTERPLPFYPWLRQITWQQLVAHHRRHLKYQARSVLREDEIWRTLSDRSSQNLAEQLTDSMVTPSQQLARSELRCLVFAALEQLSDNDREVLVLRILEQLSAQEAGAVLGLTAAAVRARQLRALKRLRQLVDPVEEM